jgi:hypothetical protein
VRERNRSKSKINMIKKVAAAADESKEYFFFWFVKGDEK